MTGLDPAVHVKPSRALQSRVDAGLKAAHDIATMPANRGMHAEQQPIRSIDQQRLQAILARIRTERDNKPDTTTLESAIGDLQRLGANLLFRKPRTQRTSESEFKLGRKPSELALEGLAVVSSCILRLTEILVQGRDSDENEVLVILNHLIAGHAAAEYACERINPNYAAQLDKIREIATAEGLKKARDWLQRDNFDWGS